MEFEPIIGLEIHIQLKTKSKLFSSSSSSFGDEVNTHVAPTDIGFPGALPSLNKEVVKYAVLVAHALKMDIDNTLCFDRKNYFYSDLPKGYQITQKRRPLGKNGVINIGEKDIRIIELHIEEDSAKQIHENDSTYLDFNRSGIPLLEIVTYPDINSGEEAVLFIEKVRSIVSFLGVSDGRMERGSLRCDVNISLKGKEDSPKVEIKNINTLNNVASAINYEITRQKELLNKGEIVNQETRRYDEKNNKTISMRKKIDSIDYRYSVETNIPPMILTKEYINQIVSHSPELKEEKYHRYLSLSLSESVIKKLLSSKEMSDYFDELIKEVVEPSIAANWLNEEVTSYLHKNEIEIISFPLSPKELGDLIKLIANGTISNKQARELFLRMTNGEKDVLSSLDKSLLSEEEVRGIINEVIDANPSVIDDIKNGKDHAIRFIIGQVMKISHGRVNPELTNKLVQEELQRRH